MTTHEAALSPLTLGELIDERICPLEQTLEFNNTAFTSEELVLINHVHGVVGGYVTGPEEVKVAVGLRILGELESFSASIDRETEEKSSQSGYEDFAFETMRLDTIFREGLYSEIDNLRFADKTNEIIPAILKRYDMEFEYPDSALDLKVLAFLKDVHKQVIRSGVSGQLRLELLSSLDRFLSSKWIYGQSPEVSLELDDQQEVTGKLEKIHRDYDGVNWLQINSDKGPQRIRHSTVKTIGVTVIDSAPKQTQEAKQKPQPHRRRLFGRNKT